MCSCIWISVQRLFRCKSRGVSSFCSSFFQVLVEEHVLRTLHDMRTSFMQFDHNYSLKEPSRSSRRLQKVLPQSAWDVGCCVHWYVPKRSIVLKPDCLTCTVGDTQHIPLTSVVRSSLFGVEKFGIFQIMLRVGALCPRPPSQDG